MWTHNPKYLTFLKNGGTLNTETDRQTQTHRVHHVKMKAEIPVMHLQGKNTRHHQEQGERHGTASERINPDDTLILDFWPPGL